MEVPQLRNGARNSETTGRGKKTAQQLKLAMNGLRQEGEAKKHVVIPQSPGVEKRGSETAGRGYRRPSGCNAT